MRSIAICRRNWGGPVRLSNDANCFALVRSHRRRRTKRAVVFGVILGTGTGGGVVVNGHAVEGLNRIAGEWGHNPLPWPRDDERPGPACYCGRSGCIETFLSGGGLSATYVAVAKADLAANDDRHVSPQAATAWPSKALDIYEERLARALASIINVLDPDVIVLGGGLSNIDRLYANVPALWQPFVFSDGPVDTRLLPPRHGDSSGVRGAAWLWRDNDEDPS